MELIINKFGARIKKKYERIAVSFPNTNQIKEYPVRRLSKIIIMAPSSITSGAVQLALAHDVDIVYLERRGMPYGRIYGSKPGRLTEVKRKQIETTKSEKATYISRQMIFGKITNQQRFLATLPRDFADQIEKMRSIAQLLNLIKGPIEYARDQLFGLEGRAADLYFQALREIIRLPGRQPQGTDMYNMSLNYGYGILYNEVERYCLLAGLDPFVGFLHTERYGKVSLVFDVIEEWRVPVVDSTLIPLFINHELADSTEFFGADHLLNKRARKIIVQAVFDRLHAKTVYNGKTMHMLTAMKHHTYDLAAYLLGRKREYRPFLYNFDTHR